MYVLWKLVSVRFEILLVLAQDRYTVCAECTSGMEIIFGTPVVLQGVMSHVEAPFGALGGSVTLGAR